ncbi:MAG: hypothetical protein Kow0020_07430 [Wenzhouxiangellaceae bacterium]
MDGLAGLIDWAAQHPGWVVTAGFLLSLIEAIALLGVLVPGIFLLFVLGAAVGWNPPLLLALMMACAVGAMIGDGVSFLLGRRVRARLRDWGPMRRNPGLWLRAEDFIARHGGRSVFIARFIGPLRPVVPLVAGSLGMPSGVFVPRMVAACVLWSPVMLLPGVIAGESLELAAELGGRLSLLLVLLATGLWFLSWLVRAVYAWGARRAQWWLRDLARWLRRHRLLGRWLGGLVEPGRRETTGVLLLGLMLLLSLAGLVVALVMAPFSTAAWAAGFRLSGLAASLRSPMADPWLLAVWLSASWPVLGVVVSGFAALLAVQRAWRALAYWLACTVGGGLLAWALDALLAALLGRPEGAAAAAQVPHLRFTLAVLAFGFMAQLIARAWTPRRRKWLYLIVVLWLALLGFSDFYFGQATLNGLLTGTALAGGWLAATAIGYRVHAWPVARPSSLLTGFALIWLAATLWVLDTRFAVELEAQRLAPEARVMAGPVWRAGAWASLPDRRSRIGRVQVTRFDAQIVADEALLREALARAGYTAPPQHPQGWLYAWLSPTADPGRIGHLGREFAGRPQRLMLRRMEPDGSVLLVRAWDSGVRLAPCGLPVWLLQVEPLRLKRVFGLFNHWTRVAGAQQALRRLADDLGWHFEAAGAGAVWLGWPAASARGVVTEQVQQHVEACLGVVDREQGLRDVGGQ